MGLVVRVSTYEGNDVLSVLAVIGYIFIIIYSNRKRYLGMGRGIGLGLTGYPLSVESAW